MLIVRAESSWQSGGDLYVREILSDSGLWMYMLLIQYVMIIYQMYGVYGSSILSGVNYQIRESCLTNSGKLATISFISEYLQRPAARISANWGK